MRAPGVYTVGMHYTILTAGCGVAGAFADATTDGLPFLSFGLSYDPHNAYLDVARSNVSFASAGLTPNQIATGGGVDSLGLGGPLVGALLQLDRPQARSAFDQLSGEIHASARTALIEDSRFVRMAAGRCAGASSRPAYSSGLRTSTRFFTPIASTVSSRKARIERSCSCAG